MTLIRLLYNNNMISRICILPLQTASSSVIAVQYIDNLKRN